METFIQELCTDGDIYPRPQHPDSPYHNLLKKGETFRLSRVWDDTHYTLTIPDSLEEDFRVTAEPFTPEDRLYIYVPTETPIKLFSGQDLEMDGSPVSLGRFIEKSDKRWAMSTTYPNRMIRGHFEVGKEFLNSPFCMISPDRTTYYQLHISPDYDPEKDVLTAVQIARTAEDLAEDARDARRAPYVFYL